MIIRIPGSGWIPDTFAGRYTNVCRSLYSFYFLACIMHVEASLHCQWRIGKVPPISDRRHFSGGQSVCRRFLKNVLTRVIVQVLGKLRKFFALSRKVFIYLREMLEKKANLTRSLSFVFSCNRYYILSIKLYFSLVPPFKIYLTSLIVWRN